MSKAVDKLTSKMSKYYETNEKDIEYTPKTAKIPTFKPVAVEPVKAATTSNLDKAKALLQKQGALQPKAQSTMPTPTLQPRQKTVQTLMPRTTQETLEKAKQIQQRAQGKTPQQLREQNIANIKKATADSARSFGYGTERIGAGALGAVEDVMDFAGATGAKIMGLDDAQQAWASRENIADRWKQSIQERYNPTQGVQMVGNLNETIGRMLPAAAVGVAGAGAAGIGAAAKAANAQKAAQAIMGIGAAGAGMQEAAQNGATADQAIRYGTAVGLLESTIESIAGNLPGLPKGKITQIIEAAKGSPIVATMADIVGEGGEEALSTLITPYIQRAMYDPDAQNATGAEIWQSAAMGMIAGGIMQGAGGNIDLTFRSGVESELLPAAGENAKAAALAGALTEGATPNWGKNIAETQRTDTQHTPEMQKIMQEYDQAADPGVVEYAKKVRSGAIDKKTPYNLGKTAENTAKKIYELTGIDVSGNTDNLMPNTIEHIDNGHGINGETDHSMADDLDIARIKYVIDNFDDAVLEPKTAKGYSTKDGKPAPMIKFIKRVDGSYYIVEAVSDAKTKRNYIVTAYKAKANENGTAQQPLNGTEAPKSTSKTSTADSVPNTTIAQSTGEVKRPASLRQRVALPEEITYAPDQADRSNSADNAPEAAAEMLRNSNDGMLMTTLGDLEDVADQIDGSGSYMNLDIARVLDKVAGNNQELRTRLHNAIEKPLTNAKAGYAQNVVDRMKQYKADMDRLGIKVGSKESAAVQWYGEGQRQINANGETVPYSFEQLKVEFPNNWQNIVEAEKIHRQIYDEYVERINAALSLVYPDVEGNAQTELLEKQDKMNQALEKLALQQELVQTLQDKVKALTQQTRSTDPVAATRAKQELLKVTRQVGMEMNRAGKLSADAKKAVDNHDKLEAEINSGAYYKNKRLTPRKDYFHHFVDMEKSGSLQALKNILNRPSDIAAELVGKSDFTKPKSKFWGAMQHRTGAAYTEDAVAGMARYIPQAEYKINIDPLIAQMRGTVKSLVDGSSATRNANGFIEFLTDWTNDLAGKTNPIDRAAQKIVGRKTMKVLEWVNNRVKANAVVGNIGSAIVQIGNIPNATTYVPNAAYWTKAAATMANAEKAQTLLAQSPFLNERYMGSTTSMFDQKGALQKGAEWVLEIGDHKASELIWLAAYNQYEATGGKVNGPRQYDNAVDYADDITRRSVAGRGIGELPLIQRSRVVKLFAPFQVEVNNSWNLMKEQIGAKNAKGLIAYCVNAWIINSIIAAVANKTPLFDPIQALIEAIQAALGEEQDGTVQGLIESLKNNEKSTEEGSAGEAAKRLFGEVAANVPYATALAPMFFDTDDMEKVFGEQDPTRYGTGLSATADLMTQAGNLLNDKKVDWLGLATTYVTPYGGQQLERVVRAGQNFGYLPRRVVVDEKGNTELKRVDVPGSYNTSGKLRFGIEPTVGKLAVNAAFGDYATPEGREYIEGGYQPMSEKQTVMATKAAEMGIPANTITWVIRNKGKSHEEATKAIRQTVGLTKQQKAWLWKEVTGGADKNNPFK